MKSIKKVIKKVFAILSVVVVLASVQMIGFSASAAELPNMNTAYALTAGTGVAELDDMLSNFNSFISGISVGLGGVIFIWAVWQIGQALLNHDSTARIHGFIGIVVAMMFIAAPSIAAFLQS